VGSRRESRHAMNIGPVGDITPEQMDELTARWKGGWERDRNKLPKLLTPLPRRVRVRLWLEHRVNGAGIWLAGHGHWKAAERLWRVCGMW